MASLTIVADTIPQRFGHAACDWLELFVSRAVAVPLIAQMQDGTYEGCGLESVVRVDERRWQLSVDRARLDGSRELMQAWRRVRDTPHRASLAFLRRVEVVDDETIAVETAKPLEDIRPHLDSPWLWARMDLAETQLQFDPLADLTATARLSNGSTLKIVGTRVHDLDTGTPLLYAGLPTPEAAGAGSIAIDTNVMITVMPSADQARLGPFVAGGTLSRVQTLVAQKGWGGALCIDDTIASAITQHEARSRVPAALSYTDFYPNRFIAQAVAQIADEYGGPRISLAETVYASRVTWHPDADLSLILIAPQDGLGLHVVRPILQRCAHLLDSALVASIQRDLAKIESDANAPCSQALVRQITGALARATGYGPVGRYRGWFNATDLELPRFTADGYVDLERILL